MQPSFDGLREGHGLSAPAPFQRHAILAALAIGIATLCLLPFADHK